MLLIVRFSDIVRYHLLTPSMPTSAYLGSVGRGDLVGSDSLMSPKRDPRAPVKPSAEDLREHRGYLELAALVLKRGSLGECRIDQSGRTPPT